MDSQIKYLYEEVHDAKQREYRSKHCLKNNGRVQNGNSLSVGLSFLNFNFNSSFTFPLWQYHEEKEQRNTFYLQNLY